jgi:tetratricopeptide (TPR) repeat protein
VAADGGYGSNPAFLALWRQLDDAAGLAATLDRLGFAQHQFGQSPQAVTYLEEALSLRLRLGQREREAQSRSILGLALQRSGRWPEAQRQYEHALTLARELGDPGLEARLLNNLGGLASNLGEPEQQQVYLDQALALRRAIGDELGEAITLNNLGAFHRGLGEVEEALVSYAAALQIFERLDNRYWQARTLNNAGYAYLTLGEPERARAYLMRALPLRREQGDRQGEATTLRNLARAAADLGDRAEALAFAQRALDGSLLVSDRRGATTARKLLGELRLAEHQPAEAKRELEAALATVRELGDRQEEAEVQSLLGEVELLRGSPAKAAALATLALALHRTVRNPLGEIAALATLASAERALGRPQAAAARVAAALELLGSLQGRLGDPDRRAAFRATQRQVHELEVDLLMEQHRRQPSSGYDRKALEASERARSQALLTVLENAGAGLGGVVEPELRERLRRAERRFAAKTRLQVQLLGGEHTPEQARHAEQGLLAALTDLDSLRALARRRNPRYAPLSSPPSLETTAIRQQLDADTVLLEVFLGERRSYLWFVTSRSVTAYELAPRQTIEELADRLHQELGAVQQRDGKLYELLATLGRVVLGPIADRLSYSRQEAEVIAALVPPGQRLLALASEARRSRVIAGELADYRILHFATHGLVNPRIPELSGLLLTQQDAAGHLLDGFLGLRDISSLDLSAELVVLSGCETALGREVRGEGLLGLTRRFMVAGVPRVIASLWQVRDQATAELMAHFYRALLVEHQPPAAALRSAQLALRQQRRWRDPYYWAAFVFQGDWRPAPLSDVEDQQPLVRVEP